MTKVSMQLASEKAKPFLGVVFLQTFNLPPQRKIRPKMIISAAFLKIMLLSLMEPVIGQNLYFLGMKYTTATFAAAMTNALPASFRLEKVKMMSIHSQAKLLGTLATVAGAMIMTLVRGPNLDFPWTRGAISPAHINSPKLVFITQSRVPALFINHHYWMLWLGRFHDLAGIAYYLQGVVMKERGRGWGPVFVTAFSPLNMVMVAILSSSFILAEKMFLGRVVGAFVIVMGQTENHA